VNYDDPLLFGDQMTAINTIRDLYPRHLFFRSYCHSNDKMKMQLNSECCKEHQITSVRNFGKRVFLTPREMVTTGSQSNTSYHLGGIFRRGWNDEATSSTMAC